MFVDTTSVFMPLSFVDPHVIRLVDHIFISFTFLKKFNIREELKIVIKNQSTLLQGNKKGSNNRTYVYYY